MKLQKRLCTALKQGLSSGRRPPLPAGGDLLWLWFSELSATRTYGMSGPNPITHSEIESYGRAARWPIRPDHIRILRAMDSAWLAEVYDRRAKLDDKAKSLPLRSAHSMNAGLFDALFG